MLCDKLTSYMQKKIASEKLRGGLSGKKPRTRSRNSWDVERAQAANDPMRMAMRLRQKRRGDQKRLEMGDEEELIMEALSKADLIAKKRRKGHEKKMIVVVPSLMKQKTTMIIH